MPLQTQLKKVFGFLEEVLTRVRDSGTDVQGRDFGWQDSAAVHYDCCEIITNSCMLT